jgi:hypothetical protein
MDDGGGWLWLLVPLLFMVFGPLLWIGVCVLLAYVARWPALAARFPAPGPPQGTALPGQVTGIGLVRDNVTTLHVSPQGLYMTPMILFRPGRKPVLVPWAQVKYVSPGISLWGRVYVLDLGGVTTLRVRENGYAAIHPWLVGAGSPAAPPSRED